ncbi:MAG TPA: hypothetical protein DEA22_06520, partial [Blastocatellia bacterium]|nr:hypothetical protein [Blastocatellia bacterium]
VVCPRCSAQLPNDSRFCGRCGFSFSQSFAGGVSVPAGSQIREPSRAERLCRTCGAAYPPHIRFCGRCGHSMI